MSDVQLRAVRRVITAAAIEDEWGQEALVIPRPIRRQRPLSETARLKREEWAAATAGYGPQTWPWGAPGMPPPGPNFAAAAGMLTESQDSEMTSQQVWSLYRRALRTPGFTLPIAAKENSLQPVSFVPGHLWGPHADPLYRKRPGLVPPPSVVSGPQAARVMVLGKMPWKEEIEHNRNLVGASGEVLREALAKLHAPDPESWYLTNLVKFMPPLGEKNLRADWIRDCLPLLHQELRLVRPDYILCLGADALKAIAGKNATIAGMEGRVLSYPVDRRFEETEAAESEIIKVMAVLHPADVARNPDKAGQFERGLGKFLRLIEHGTLDVPQELDYRVIRTLPEAAGWICEVNRELADVPIAERLIAWDAEWQGARPDEPGSYLRTLQASWKHGAAVTFRLRDEQGQPAFFDNEGYAAEDQLLALLTDFCRDKRAVGHFFFSDLEWLRPRGFDPTLSTPVPLYADEEGRSGWERLREGEGWLDTAMMAHAIDETSPLGLESLTQRYTDLPRYDLQLEEAKKAYCKANKIKIGELEGYGFASDDVILSYSNFDADTTRRCAVAMLSELDADRFGNCCWEACWESMIVQPVIVEMRETGLLLDQDLTRVMIGAYGTAKVQMERRIREWAFWPEFNVRSVFQVREFLFGERYNGAKKPGRLRPAEAKSLELRPLLDTSKPPRPWDEVERDGLPATAGTGKLVLGGLMLDHPEEAEQVGWIRGYRFLDQLVKTVLRPPELPAATERNDEDVDEMDLPDGADRKTGGTKGLLGDVWRDGRIRTRLRPTAETGRWKSSRINLQAISKKREKDYAQLLGDRYPGPIRTCFVASPGQVLIEFDYTGAELFTMAIMSGDPTMTDHAIRSCLPEDAPNYYDIHSSIAVEAFQLDCESTKKGLKAAGKSYLRDCAKSVVFGVAYGRSAKAVALGAREEGIAVTEEEAAAVLARLFDLYPNLMDYFERAARRAEDPRWICSPFGRYRRFGAARDRTTEGGLERQAKNYTIQSPVASCVDRGLAILQDLRDNDLQQPDLFRLCLQIHDAGMVQAPAAHVPYLVKELIPYAMSDCVPFYPADFDGRPLGTGPYHLGLEINVYRRWGTKLTTRDCQELGLSPEYAKT